MDDWAWREVRPGGGVPGRRTHVDASGRQVPEGVLRDAHELPNAPEAGVARWQGEMAYILKEGRLEQKARRAWQTWGHGQRRRGRDMARVRGARLAVHHASDRVHSAEGRLVRTFRTGAQEPESPERRRNGRPGRLDERYEGLRRDVGSAARGCIRRQEEPLRTICA